jgi:ParB/RepB/Spo0J family partition protein
MTAEAIPILELALGEIRERFAALRIPNPAAERALRRSIERYGQLAPVVVREPEPEGGYELLDGFKRLRAARALAIERLRARVLPLGAHASKAAILELNWVGQSINHLEEALVLHSLLRDDGLTQVEIAALLRRHKSWVSRRIALVERLCDEVQESLRLGLLNGSIARELARLPRGNQPPALATIHKHRLSWRETAQLVSLLIDRPRWEHATLLWSPWAVIDLSPGRHPKLTDDRAPEPAARLERQLLALEKSALAVTQALHPDPLLGPAEDVLRALAPLVDRTLRAAQRVLERLQYASVLCHRCPSPPAPKEP